MRILNFALFFYVCVVVGQLASTVDINNGCTGPPPQYNNSAFDDCLEQGALPGGCNCKAANQTCLHGDRLFYNCSHDTDLDFVIVCDYKQGNRYGWIVDTVNGTELVDKFENCTGSEAPLKETITPRPTPSPFLGCIRLVESQTTPNETSGILQMYNDTWSSVCYTAAWNRDTLANITCRMLGFSSSLGQMQLPINQRPTNFSTDAWEVNIDYCSGREQTLWECDLANNRSDWLTFAEFGSNRCPSLLKISCKVNTTLSDLTYCPPITTTPYPTTSVDHTEDSLTDKDPTASEHEFSPGFSTGGIVAIAVGAIAGVVLLALVAGRLCCKRNNRRRGNGGHNSQRRAQPPPVRETDEQASDNNSTPDEQEQEMRRLEEASDERLSNQVQEGTSGTAANQASTDRDNSQSTGEPSATEPVPAGQPDSPKRPGSDMTPIDS